MRRRLGADITRGMSKMEITMSDVSAAQVRAWHDELASLEEQIDALQEKKKHVYERIVVTSTGAPRKA